MGTVSGGHYYLKKSPNWVLPSASIQPSFASDEGEKTKTVFKSRR
jgi:hypothetical protein